MKFLNGVPPRKGVGTVERFNDALQKMASVSIGYRDGRVKHVQFSEQMDALITASGWSAGEFYKEIDRRRSNLGK
jgi:hypothetical protein